MKEPFVEIILLNYNNAQMTIDCIESLYKNDYQNKCICVVDNNSTDDSQEILRSYQSKKEFVFLPQKSNDGFSAGNNIGIEDALSRQADYVILLNNDTYVEPNFLTEIIKFQEQHKNSALAIGKIYYADKPLKLWYAGGSYNCKTSRTVHFRYNELVTDDEKTDRAKPVSFATGCCFCLRAETIQEVGLLDEDYFLYAEDTDYCDRIIRKNKKMYYVPTAVVYHRVSASTGEMSDMTQFYLVRNSFMLIKKNYGKHKKIVPYLYNFAMFLRRCCKKEMKWKWVVKGYRAFLKGEVGKHQFQ